MKLIVQALLTEVAERCRQGDRFHHLTAEDTACFYSLQFRRQLDAYQIAAATESIFREYSHLVSQESDTLECPCRPTLVINLRPFLI